jgi:hypothetical protein
MMNQGLAPYLGKFCVIYVDDVLIYSKTADEHLEHIRLVLQTHVHIKLSKCYFRRSSVNFLGHVVESEHIGMDSDKVEAVQNWPPPKCFTKVRGFLGLAGYYQKFINQFATLATPLTDMSKKTPEFRWTPQAQ